MSKFSASWKRVAVLAALLFPATAAAQDPANPEEMAAFMSNRMSEIMFDQKVPYQYRGKVEQEEAFDVATKFARCAVKLNEGMARDLLDRAMSEEGIHIDDEQAYYDRLRGCAIRRMYMDRDFMRGSLASFILLRSPEMADVASAKTEEELVEFLTAVEVGKASFEDAITSTQIGFECRAAMVPSAAYRILEQEPGSEAEAAAFKALTELTPYCDPAFRDDELSHWFSRLFVARGLYHWNQFRNRSVGT